MKKEEITKDNVANYIIYRNSKGRKIDLSGLDLSGVNFYGMFLEYADMKHCNLEGANLSRASLKDVDLRYSNLRNAKLMEFYCNSTNFHHCDLNGCRISLTPHYNEIFFNNKSVNFEGAILNNNELHRVNLSDVTFRNTHMYSMRFSSCKLKNITFDSIKGNVRFVECNFIDCDFEKNELDRFRFKRCSFNNIYLLTPAFLTKLKERKESERRNEVLLSSIFDD